MEEGGAIDHSQMDRLLKDYYRRVRQILRMEFNSKNKMTTINTLAVLVDWLKKLRRPTLIDYIERRNGGHGFVELEAACIELLLLASANT